MTVLTAALALLVAGAVHLAAPTGGDPGGPDPGGGDLGGFTLGHLPAGIGTATSDFATEWGGVAFASRVWERTTPGGGARVDLKVNVLSGERLADPGALRDFLAEYHEIDAAAWKLTDLPGGGTGQYAEGHAFWLAEPGLAVSLRLDPDRFGTDDLLAVTEGVRRTG
jgi:hypothetical protein